MVVSNIFYVHPYLGKIPIWTHIFQVGWNHQLGFNNCTLDFPFASTFLWRGLTFWRAEVHETFCRSVFRKKSSQKKWSFTGSNDEKTVIVQNDSSDLSPTKTHSEIKPTASMIYFPTFTIKINHPCSWIYTSSPWIFLMGNCMVSAGNIPSRRRRASQRGTETPWVWCYLGCCGLLQSLGFVALGDLGVFLSMVRKMRVF